MFRVREKASRRLLGVGYWMRGGDLAVCSWRGSGLWEILNLLARCCNRNGGHPKMRFLCGVHDLQVSYAKPESGELQLPQSAAMAQGYPVRGFEPDRILGIA